MTCGSINGSIAQERPGDIFLQVSVESGPFWVKCHGRSEAILDPAQTSFKKFRKFNPNDEIFRTEEILQGEQEGPGQSCNRGAESIEPVSTPAKKKTSIKSRKRSADTLLRDAVPDTGCATDDAVSFSFPLLFNLLSSLTHHSYHSMWSMHNVMHISLSLSYICAAAS